MQVNQIPHVYSRIVEIDKPQGGRWFSLEDGTNFGLAPVAEPSFREIQVDDLMLIDLRAWATGNKLAYVFVYRTRKNAPALYQIASFAIGEHCHLDSPVLNPVQPELL